MYAEWNGKLGSTQTKTPRSSVGLIGMIMDAVVSTCQSEAQGAEGKM